MSVELYKCYSEQKNIIAICPEMIDKLGLGPIHINLEERIDETAINTVVASTKSNPHWAGRQFKRKKYSEVYSSSQGCLLN